MSHLVLSRNVGEEIIIDNGRIVVEVVAVHGHKVRLGFRANESITINRKEIQDLINNVQEQRPV